MQQEEVDVSSKALEQSEEISIPRQRVTEWIAQRVTEWTAFVRVVPANTLEREIEPVPNLQVPSAGTVGGLLSIDSICWENYPGAMREQAIEKATALARAEMDKLDNPE